MLIWLCFLHLKNFVFFAVSVNIHTHAHEDILTDFFVVSSFKPRPLKNGNFRLEGVNKGK